VQRLNSSAADFNAKLKALLATREADTGRVADAVKGVIADVRARGDAAVIAYTKQWDKVELTSATLRVSEAAVNEAMNQTPAAVKKALETAAARIEAYSQAQMPENHMAPDGLGNQLGWRWSAIERVGLYVPGGKASYPSSVLMNAVPAKVAGAKRLVAVVPTPSATVLAACAVAGISEIYQIGGAQAIAALAYGTETIEVVDKIVGPGNAYVAEAKRQVFGRVGIDMIAGPSEVLVVADATQNPKHIAADLLSQAEHDELAQAILITDSPSLADAVEKEVAAMLETLPRKAIAGASWRDFGAIITLDNLADAAAIINTIAPEHLELMVAQPEALLAAITHAGAIFIGGYTPEAMGDYIAGPSHVLPTSQTARFASGLSVFDFLKRTSLIECSKAGFAALAPQAIALADMEGLHAHALSMRLRGEP
jgi:histidinol dehydrogenase